MNVTTISPIIATKKVHKVHIIAYRMKIKLTFQQMMSDVTATSRFCMCHTFR